MENSIRYDAGLVFLRMRTFDIIRLGHIAGAVLEGHGMSLDAARADSPCRFRMRSGDLRITVAYQQLGGDAIIDPYMPCTGSGMISQAAAQKYGHTEAVLEISVSAPAQVPADDPAPKKVLALMTRELVHCIRPDVIYWLHPDAQVGTDTFIAIMARETAADVPPPSPSPTSPAAALAVPGAGRAADLLPCVEATTDQLDDDFEAIQTGRRAGPSRARHLVEAQKAARVAPRRVKCQGPSKTPRVISLSSHERVLRKRLNDAVLDLARRDAEAEAEIEAELMVANGAPQSAPTRLATWAVSLTVACLALPVGGALLAYNLLGGEDLRVASQGLALTGSMTALVPGGMASTLLTIFAGA